MATKRPAPRASSAAIAASQHQQQRMAQQSEGASSTMAGEGAGTSKITSTHLYASSIAVPSRACLDQLESQLLERSGRVEPFVQRDVVMQRLDDLDEERMAVEQADSSYGPMRRARVQSRLHVRLESGKAELRLYSQAQQRAPTAQTSQAQSPSASSTDVQGGSSASTTRAKEPDYIRVKNLTCLHLQGDDATKCDGFGDEGEFDNEGKCLVSPSIDPEHGLWEQITEMMGWTPHHSIVRRGRRFVLRDTEGHCTEALLFQLYKVDKDKNRLSLQKVSDTTVLQLAATISLLDAIRQEPGPIDPSKVTERACGDIVALHDALRGLAEFSKDVE